MTAITLQISLPAELELTPAELVRITGRKTISTQMAWLNANQWTYSLDADKGIVVGKLYAHLRLAGLHPVDVQSTPAAAGGFNMSAVR
jgi:hypothetical protein